MSLQQLYIHENLKELYKELIIEHASAPRNFIHLDNPTISEESFNPLCGDLISLFLITDNNTIVKATFQGQGCAVSTASASIMTEIILGKNIQEINKLMLAFIEYVVTDKKEINSLELPKQLLALSSIKNYPSRIKCATLAWYTLKSILKKLT